MECTFQAHPWQYSAISNEEEEEEEEEEDDPYATKLSPCGALSRFGKIEIHAPTTTIIIIIIITLLDSNLFWGFCLCSFLLLFFPFFILFWLTRVNSETSFILRFLDRHLYFQVSFSTSVPAVLQSVCFPYRCW